jgi:hypothetical protein
MFGEQLFFLFLWLRLIFLFFSFYSLVLLLSPLNDLVEVKSRN